MPRVTIYYLRGSGQPTYNNFFTHDSFSYIIAHIWNSLPLSTKSAHSVQQFRLLIKNVHANEINLIVLFFFNSANFYLKL